MPAFITGETPQEQTKLNEQNNTPEQVETIDAEKALTDELNNSIKKTSEEAMNNDFADDLKKISDDIYNKNIREEVINSNHGSEIGHPYLEDDDTTPEVSVKKPYVSGFFETRIERFGFIMFMLPIILMSAVSMIHLVDFFKIGTHPFTAWLLAIAFELASLSTISALILLKKMKKSLLIVVFFLLYTLQLVGNVYAPFSFIDPGVAQKLFQFFGFTTMDVNAQRYVSLIQGAILPTVNLFLFKMASNYLNTEKKDI